MADRKYISLRVCGRPESNGGFSHIVMFNSPSFEIEDRVYGGFDTNSYFFSVIIEKNQVVYKLIKNNVSSYGAIRQGNLVIAISTPKGYKIAGGYSPYVALIKLKNKFLESCMICKDSTTERYEFNKGLIDSTILDESAKEFEIIPIDGPYHPMTAGNPIGYIMVGEEKIRELLTDVQYPLFENYSEVIVAERVQGTIYTPIANISIPRVREYAIFVDGSCKNLVANTEQPLTVSGNGNPVYYENKKITFSIRELQNGNYIEGVHFDEANEVVHVSSKKLVEPRSKTIQLVFLEDKEYFFSHKHEWSLIFNGQIVSLTDGLTFTVRGEEIANLSNPKGYSLSWANTGKYKLKSISIVGDEMEITTEAVPFSRIIPASGSLPEQTPETNTRKKMGVREIVLSLVGNEIFDIDEEYPCRLVEIIQFDQYENMEVIQNTKVTFDKDKRNYLTKIYIPNKWNSSNYYVRISGKGQYFISVRSLGFKSEDTIELHDKDFRKLKKSFVEKDVKPNKWLFFVIGILIGFFAGSCVGYVCHDPIRKLFSKEHFICDKCEQAFDSSEALDEHKSAAHPVFPCDKCKQVFDSSEELAEHKSAAHPVFSCDKCKQAFDSEKALAEHKSAAHPVKMYKCKHCDNESFKSEEELSRHQKAKHHFVCDQCGKNVWFTSQEELNNHKKLKHER